MNQNEYIDHEVRIRMVENAIIKIDQRLETMEAEMMSGHRALLNKMDSQFHWVLTIIFTFLGGIILHMAKLI